MTTLPDTDDNKTNRSEEIKTEFQSHNDYHDSYSTSSPSSSPTIHQSPKSRNKRRNNNKRNTTNDGLKHVAMKKNKKKIFVPKLTNLCLEVMYQNITHYESFDFIPQDLAA
eukprot:517055_1